MTQMYTSIYTLNYMLIYYILAYQIGMEQSKLLSPKQYVVRRLHAHKTTMILVRHLILPSAKSPSTPDIILVLQ